MIRNTEQEISFNVFTTSELSFQQLQSKASVNGVEAKLLRVVAFFEHAESLEKLFARFNAHDELVTESAKLLTWLEAFIKGTSHQWHSD